MEISLLVKFLALIMTIILFAIGIRRKGIPLVHIFLFASAREHSNLLKTSLEVPTVLLSLSMLGYYVETGSWLIG